MGVDGEYLVLHHFQAHITIHEMENCRLFANGLFDPSVKLGYYVVSSLSLYTTVGNNTVSHGLVAAPQCSSSSNTCKIETTKAPAGKSLNFWYFKTKLNSIGTPKTPGNLLELKASWLPIETAPV